MLQIYPKWKKNEQAEFEVTLLVAVSTDREHRLRCPTTRVPHFTYNPLWSPHTV